MWIGSMILEYVIYIMWVYEQSKKYLFTIYTFKLTFGSLGGAIIPALFIRIIVHPSTIAWNIVHPGIIH